MRKVVLSTLAAAALAFDALPDSNIAYRRAVYQSSAADFTHVGHLVTDGALSTAPVRQRTSCSEKTGAGSASADGLDGMRKAPMGVRMGAKDRPRSRFLQANSAREESGQRAGEVRHGRARGHEVGRVRAILLDRSRPPLACEGH